jgi:beta-N-acetylhexosaminidase
MLMARGLDIFPEETYSLLRKGLLGGVQVRGRNTRDQIKEALALSPTPLFTAADMEEGFFGENFDGTALPCEMALGAIGSEADAYDWASIMAREARDFGVNFVFGPVADMANEPAHPYASIRCAGSDKKEIVRLCAAMINGYQDNGMQVSLKHYPGAGRFDNDNHIEPVILKCGKRTFECEELFIYKELVRICGVNGIMSGHIAVEAVDGTAPATVSGRLTAYLEKLGFRGLLITDSLAMKSVSMSYPPGELMIKAILAGHDIILGNYNIPPDVQFEFMVKAFRDGVLTEDRVNRSHEKITRAKETLPRIAALKPDRRKHRKTARSISRRSITLAGDEDYPARIKGKNTLFIIAKEKQCETSGNEITEESSGADIFRLVRDRFPRADMIQISDSPGPAEIEKTMDMAAGRGSVVMIAYAMINSYKGTADFPRPLLAMIRGLRKKIRVFALIGNPFAARELPDLPCVIYAYAGGEAELAAADALAGKFRPSGKLPVTISR